MRRTCCVCGTKIDEESLVRVEMKLIKVVKYFCNNKYRSSISCFRKFSVSKITFSEKVYSERRYQAKSFVMDLSSVEAVETDAAQMISDGKEALNE